MLITDNLKAVSAAFARHRDAVQNTLHEYRENISQCSARYAPDFAKQKIAEAKEVASAKIVQADNDMHNSVMEIVSTARRDIRAAITSAPDENFSVIMRDYKYHNLKMSETEVRAFAEQTAGSYTGLRILQSVAGESGFHVSVSSVADIDADIKRIEKCARIPSMYTPTEYIKEASELFGEKPYFSDDGSVYHRSGKPDSLYLTLVNSVRSSLETDLETVIPDKWAQVGTVKIEQATDATSEADASEVVDNGEESAVAEPIDDAQNKHKEFAEAMSVTATNAAMSAVMNQNKAAATQHRDVLSHYVRK